MHRSIVIVGGGFAGMFAALAATRVLDGEGEVTLISREPRLVVRPRLFEARPAALHADLTRLLATAGVRFVQGKADTLDLSGRTVRLASGPALTWDRLVVATGSVMRRPPIAGAETAFSIDTQAEAVAFDRRLQLRARRPHLAVAVIGAGFTGIELALNLRERVALHAGRRSGERLRIVLIDQAEAVGPELGSGPRPAIEAALADAGVELRLGARLAGIEPERVVFEDGQAMAVDAVVLCTGLEAAPFLRQLPGERDDLGRVRVDAFLRAALAEGVFVAGDAAWAAPEPGRSTLMSCQHAVPLGKFAGENAARDLLGRELLAYSQPNYGTCLDLGPSGAVLTKGWERTVQMTGQEAKAIKRQINTRLIYPPDGGRDEILSASIPS